MSTWIIENGLLTLVVMLAVCVLCRFNRKRPALCHLLWMLAFVSLVLPPIPLASAPGTHLRSQLTSALFPRDVITAQTVVAETPTTDSAISLDLSLPADVAVTATASDEPAQPSWIMSQIPAVTGTQWAVLFWLVGGALLMSWSVRRILLFHRLVRSAPGAPQDLLDSIEDVAQKMDIAAPTVRLLEGIGSPAIWCFGRPQLIWPASSGLAVRHVGESSLIAHELAHLARRDHWVSRLDVIAIGLCWWNPLFWIIRRQVRYYAELSCDAWALWAYPTRSRVFAEALIDAQERTRRAPMAMQGLCATNSEFKNFERRLNMIMSKNISRQVSKGAAAVALLTTLLVLPGFSVQDMESELEVVCEDTASVQCIDGLIEVKQLSAAAEKLFRSEDWDAAIPAFEKVLALHAKNGAAHGRLGYMAVGRGDFEMAEKHFMAEVKLGHEVDTAIYNLSCTAARAGQEKKALAYLEQSVRRGFTNSDLMAEDSDLASLRELVAYKKAIADTRMSAELRKKLNYGETELAAKDRLEIHRALAAIATEDGKLQDQFGQLLLLEKDYEAGLNAFKRQAAVGFDVGRANYNIACANALLGRSDAALAALDLAVQKGMSYAAVLEDDDLASLRGSERFKELAQQLMAPKQFKEKLEGAIASGELKVAAQALTDLMNGAETKPETRGWAAQRLGLLQLKADEPKAALASFERAVAEGHYPEEAAFYMGVAHAALGDVEAGMKHFEKAIVLGFAKPELMTWGLESANRADTEAGQALVKKASARADMLKKEASGKMKPAVHMSQSDWAKKAEEAGVKLPQ